MKDRVSLYPGRVLITPEDGSTPYHATLTRADEPTQIGDSLGKATFLKDATAALYGLTSEAVPDDVFSKIAPLSQYWWKKTAGSDYVESTTSLSELLYICNNEQSRTVQYATSISIDQSTGNISLKNPQSIEISYSNRAEAPNLLKGKYILGASEDPDLIYKIGTSASERVDTASGSSLNITIYFYATGYTFLVNSTPKTVTETLVTSENKNAYPDNGEIGNVEYRYLGNFLIDGPGAKIETTEYVGTGTTSNSLVFSAQPKLVIIVNCGDNGGIGTLSPSGGSFVGYNTSTRAVLSRSFSTSFGSDGSITWSSDYASSALNDSTASYHAMAII